MVNGSSASNKTDYTRDQQRLLDIMMDPKHSPIDRAKAGKDINQVGDPRPGVLDFNFRVGDYWCLVPAGIYSLGSNEIRLNPKHDVHIGAFYIAKYPITCAQFQPFVEAKDGYCNTRWWSGIHPDGFVQQKDGFGTQHWKYANHPRAWVSWYDTAAFCHWLTANLGYEVRLPTEDEWEAAARGMRSQPYSTLSQGNTRETGIEYTSTVGMFTEWASPYNVLDMCGNVAEWTSNGYQSTDSDIRDVDSRLSNNMEMAIRGGSFKEYGVDHGNDLIIARGLAYPDMRDSRIGLRLVCTDPTAVS